MNLNDSRVYAALVGLITGVYALFSGQPIDQVAADDTAAAVGAVAASVLALWSKFFGAPDEPAPPAAS